jgi:hypothetical protein
MTTLTDKGPLHSLLVITFIVNIFIDLPEDGLSIDRNM